jgi:hypothetical protein
MWANSAAGSARNVMLKRLVQRSNLAFGNAITNVRPVSALRLRFVFRTES